MAKFAVILPAAGRSSRFRDASYKKPFAPLANKAIWLHSAERFMAPDDVVQTILVIAPEDRPDFSSSSRPTSCHLGVEVIDGGAERADSVEAALARVKPSADFVCVHDAARPCLTDAWIDQIFAAAEKTGAAIFATAVAGTLKRVADHKIVETVARENLWEAQTPQVFRRELLLEASPSTAVLRPPTMPTGRADRAARRDRARLADEHQDHHQGRSAAGRADAQGAAEAQVVRAAAPLR